ncbi:hypothetical protein ACFL0Y_01035 [Patescibacteria group bacterium]
MREKNWMKRILWLFCFLSLWLVFSFLANYFLDPDFGWQLKTGEWIWQNKTVPQKDLFSYTMPDYPWLAHSWLTDVLIYLGYSRIGYWSLAIVGGLLGAMAFMCQALPKKIYYFLGPLILAALASFDFISVRPKMISYFLAVLVYFAIKKSYQDLKWLILLPLIFWAWANLHAGFSLGLIILLIAAGVDIYFLVKRQKKVIGHLSLVLIALVISLAAIMANPYQEAIYRLIFEEMIQGQKIHYYISEWLPYSSFNFAMIIYTGIFWALLFVFKEKGTIFEKVTALTFFIVGFLSRRLMIYFFLFTLPLLSSYIEDFFRLMVQKKVFKKINNWQFWLGIAGLFLVIFSFKDQLASLDRFKEESFYPTKAITFLKEEKIEGNLFSVYSWGGYLIWKHPEKKVFGDGRMAIWEQNDYSAFREEIEIFTGKKDFRKIFEKHQVTHILIPAPKKSLASLVSGFLKRDDDIFSLREELLLAGWQVAYQDKLAVVFVK